MVIHTHEWLTVAMSAVIYFAGITQTGQVSSSVLISPADGSAYITRGAHNVTLIIFGHFHNL